MVFRRKYATAATIDGVPLVAVGSSDYKAAPTLAAGDAQISKDGGAFANLATLPTVTPAAGRAVRVALSATETTAARCVIQFVDQTSPKEWEDQFVVVETFGHASAQELRDDTADVAQTGDAFARLGAPAGASVSADVAALPTANANADALLDRADAIETGLTPRKAIRAIAAEAAGDVTGSAAAPVFSAAGVPATPRITSAAQDTGLRVNTLSLT